LTSDGLRAYQLWLTPDSTEGKQCRYGRCGSVCIEPRFGRGKTSEEADALGQFVDEKNIPSVRVDLIAAGLIML
jgi:hypothetical protein